MSISIPPGGFERRKVIPREILARLRQVGESIVAIRYERLKAELFQGVNPEINTDREMLVARMEQLGFRKDIVESLHDLDRKILAAGTRFDFKGCMDTIRTLLEEIVEDAAQKAAALTKTALPTGKLKDFQPWKDLLVTTGVLTAEE